MPFEPDGTQCLCRFANSTHDANDSNYFNPVEIIIGFFVIATSLTKFKSFISKEEIL